MTDANPLTPAQPPTRKKIRWVTPLIYEVLLAYVLVAGFALRFIGIQWGDFQYLHPDERFLIWVGTDIAPIGTPDAQLGAPPNTTNNPWRAQFPDAYPDCKTWGGYFDASCSPLNPNNRGHSFYVYGTLPMFITRYLVQAIYGHSGFNEMTVVGRVLSAFVDLLSVILVYAIGSRAFHKAVGLLAATFAAFTVLNIQQSHFFTMDTFFSFFTLLAVYFAVRVSLEERETATSSAREVESTADIQIREDNSEPSPSLSSQVSSFIRHPCFWLSIAFGVSLGCAVASKLSAAPVAFVLPVAFAVVVLRKRAEDRQRWIINAVLYLGIAAFVSILVFRLTQPYAFLGPGFFGIRPNPQWVSNIKEQRAQAAGDIDFPPSLQWARRPIWFSAQNMAEWGLGLPLAILAAFGFLWAGWRMLKGDWQNHVVLWTWGGFYFVWQSLQFNPTMRYQMPTYPILAIYAAWGLVELWKLGKRKQDQVAQYTGRFRIFLSHWAGTIAIIAGVFIVLATVVWAVAFSLIYARPITRVDASYWTYQNIPGPINLHIQTGNEPYNQPLPIPYGSTVQPGVPYQTFFTAKESGILNEIYLAHVETTQAPKPLQLDITLSDQTGIETPLFNTTLTITPSASSSTSGTGTQLNIDTPTMLYAGQVYTLTLSTTDTSTSLNACGPLTLDLLTPAGIDNQVDQAPVQCVNQPGSSTIAFPTQVTGELTTITLSQPVEQAPVSGQQTLTVIVHPSDDDNTVAIASLTANLAPGESGMGDGYTLQLDRPFTLEAGKNYDLSIALSSSTGFVVIQGSAIANEGDWDDGLPLRVDGYDPFGGMYTPGLNFNMYTDDNQDKLDHFINIFDRTEYILISSNRQWGSLPRLPERFPMSTIYYRHLLGCPDDKTIGWCYSVAKPGMFQGDLGFELVAIFQSDPTLGPFSVNDQFAEEAFTVYDHPKVLVFKKTGSYDSTQARQILSRANFGEIVRITPKKAPYHPANLLLPEVRQFIQSIGGTWSQLFNPQALINRFQPLGVLVWYLSVALLGLLIYPLLRMALPGLHDHGYPLARTSGLLILAYLTWLAGSLNIPFSRLTITIVILLIAVVGIFFAYRQREELRREWREHRRYFLVVEGLFLAFFLAFLLVRLGNPDLWHPWKGGEKPMDFSFFNAILKSTTFPPYDPWYAAGYMNYYYWGYVLVGVLVKWLGIVPSIAYNLIIPTLFSLVAMGAFCIGYNLSHPLSQIVDRWKGQDPPEEAGSPTTTTNHPYFIGIASALAMAVVGNLGTLRMFLKGWEQLGVPGGVTNTTSFLTRLAGLPVGIWNNLVHGASLPYALADWYWIPSRAIPAPNDVEPITEFPIFTFLYADLHAHMMAMAIAMLALAWAVAVLLGKAHWKSLTGGIISFLLGSLAIGALYPTNLSDIYVYLPIGMLVLGYALFRYVNLQRLAWLPKINDLWKRLGVAGAGMVLLAILAYGLYLPYRLWYAQPYSSVIPWTGTHTPLWSYLTHWGLFLFVILSWMVWETRQWMAETPLSSLRKLEKYTALIIAGVVALILACLLIGIKLPGIENMPLLSKLPIGRGVAMVWFILPLATWAGILLLRPGIPDVKRLVLFWVGTGLLITLMVEMVVVRGDIGRMNTVFKFYLIAWALFSLSAAAALGWLWEPIRGWLPGWRIFWRVAFAFLVFSAFLFTLYGGMAKIKDRWVASAPHTLDGMAYMPYATYTENYPANSPYTPAGQTVLDMDLSQDYRAIRWMQENIQGSPVIVEANSRNLYRWYSRFTIYTGLPGVVGWEWHEQQQRALNPPDWVTKRVTDIDQFYTAVDIDYVRQFLNLYQVKYIVVGQLEEVTYPGPGLEKFPAFVGNLWNEVYHDENTTIYEVIP
jgi:YYY domain-containing protein